MTDKDIELLKDLAETHNITRTAQRLYTTQSALTKRIQNIEEELGCSLFVRSKKGVLLTPFAESILPFIRDISHNLDQIRNIASCPEGELGGTLKVGVAVNHARYRLTDLLETFIENYPKVDIQVSVKRSPDLYQELQSGETNLVIIRGDYPWTEGDMILNEEKVCLVKNSTLKDADLNTIPFLDRTSDVSFEADLSKWLTENRIRRHSVLQINDVDTILQMVERNIGWTILPEVCLKDFNGIVESLSFRNGNPFKRRTHLLYRPDYFKLPQVQAFVNTVAQATPHLSLA